MYAEVLPNVSQVGATFHYTVPDDLGPRLQAGHLVVVPWGRQRIQGVVVGLDEDPPPDVLHFKSVEALVDPDPVLSRTQLDLAYWLAHHYRASLTDCVMLMIPPGLSKRADASYELLDRQYDAAGENQRRIIELLRERSPLRGRQIARALPRRRWRTAMNQLVQRGVVSRTPVLDSPSVRPKRIRTARLAIPAGQVLAAKRSLRRSSTPAEILKYLISLWPGEPVLDDLLYFVGCQRRHLRDLARKDWLEIVPKEPVVVSSHSAASIQRWLHAHRRRAPRQAAVMETLLGRQGAVPVSELPRVSRTTLKALDERDLLRYSVNPERVRLKLTIPQASEHVASLEKPDRKAKVLELLQRAGDGPLEVSRVYEETGATAHDLAALADRGLVDLGEAEILRDPLAGVDYVPSDPPALADGQQQAWAAIEAGFARLATAEADAPSAPKPFLLHGVTGSGKTEIYLRAVAEALRRGRQAIVLIPEIALTPQTVRRFLARFAGRVAVVHSRLSAGERYDTWRRARAGFVDVVVGPRSALFTPLPRPGLIVVDEEHDEAYRQDPPMQPLYHAREVAVEYARRLNAVCILGSATPDLVSYSRAQRGDYQRLAMPQRIMGHAERITRQASRLEIALRYRPLDPQQPAAQFIPLPRVQVVDMRQELRAGNRSMFSRTLQRAMTAALQRGEQIILFLNRRGQATYVFCRDCGHTIACPNCELPFTYHRTPHQMVCHHCNARRRPPQQCPKCGSKRVKYFGVGTERVEEETHKLLPAARLLRWDRDATRTKGAHGQILRRFAQRGADILIGTQMIAKGLDLPLVTLVGVVSADTGLALPDFRAAERTFQILTQVAGRAGRGLLGGQVVVQTYIPEHYAIQAAAAHDYEQFYEHELKFRREQGFPPYGRLVRLVGRHRQLDRLERQAQVVAQLLRQQIRQKRANSTTLIGPAPCFFSQIAREHRWQLVLRGPNPAALLDIDLPAGWWVEVDPPSLL